MRVAREQNVSQIILKKPAPHRLWKRLFSTALSWWLSNSGDVDIQFVEVKKSNGEQFTSGTHSYQESLLQYVKALAVAAAVTLLCTALEPEIGYQAVSLLYLLGVLFAALRLSRFATIFLAFVSAATWDFLFTVPKYTFYISKPEDVLMLVLLFTSAIIIGNLTNRLRIREEMERVGGERVKTILRFTQALSACNNVSSIRAAALAKIEEIFQTRVSILLADANGNLPEDQGDAAGLILSEKEVGVANWVFANKRPAGRFTETLADSHALHLPILSGTRIMGVLSMALETPISLQQREILETLVSQLALVLEKA
jgi:two-component system sensor histidine kinase KdpD